MISFITQTLNVILVNKCCVVAELTRRSKGVSFKWKKKHTRKHTQIPFYLKPSAGTRATSNWYLPPLIYTMYTLFYKSYFTCNCNQVLFVFCSVIFNLLIQKQVCVRSFNWSLILVSVAPVHWSTKCRSSAITSHDHLLYSVCFYNIRGKSQFPIPLRTVKWAELKKTTQKHFRIF